MILRYSDARKVFYLQPREMYADEAAQVQRAGFQWFDEAALWVTTDPARACTLALRDNCAAPHDTAAPLRGMLDNIALSNKLDTNTPVPVPEGQEYMAFQRAGVERIQDRFSAGYKAALLADPMGVGKTIQACGLVNFCYFDPERVLVLSPASLRLNWQREMDAWLTWPCEAFPIMHGRLSPAARKGPMLSSYDLTLNDRVFGLMTRQTWDLVILDESHYLKNPEAQRTERVLAPGGIADRAKYVLPMSGTPIPNWAHEFYPLLSRLAPDTINGMTEAQFSGRYTTGFMNSFGWQTTGSRNHDELSCRLRGSGFMVRREKRAVLPQLPPERHQIVVLPASTGAAEVVRKEQDNIQFTADEILNAGKPLGYGATPELRHEMGLEKVPACVDWVKDQLDGGCEKIVLFGYHQDVLQATYAALEKYNPVMVYGPTPMAQRQANVDRFQKDADCRVIIGGWQPLGVGWTLTASSMCAFIEGSFVPGDNEQCKDRLIRHGATAEQINVCYLVVEGSVEASVLAKAAMKLYGIKKITD